MQVIGLSQFDDRVDAIAARATRPDVSEWARRVLVRHMRRTRDLHEAVQSAKAVKMMAAADGLSPEVTTRILEALRGGEEILMPDRDRIEAFIARAFDTMDFMASLPAGDRRIRRIERLSWLDAEKMSEDWHAALAKRRSATANLMSGLTRLADFDDGSFVAELKTAAALKAEGDAMGHCVGGYWGRVQTGVCRIVSLRDAEGKPHATIELNRLVAVPVEGLGEVSIVGGVRPGANEILPGDVQWYAGQIRGKQNHFPVEKYAEKVRKWLEHARVPSREPGFTTNFREHGFTRVYAVPKGRDFEFFSDAGRAFQSVAEQALEQIRNTPLSIKSVCQRLGILSLARDVDDTAMLGTFLESAVAEFVAQLGQELKHGSVNALRLIRESGLETLVAACSRGQEETALAMSRLAGVLVDFDTDAPLKSRDELLVGNGKARGLTVRVHDIPSIGLSMMGAGRAHGLEDRILNGIEPKLRRIVEEMKARPDVYHVIRPTKSNVRPEEIVQAMFACGLGTDYVTAVAFVQSGVRSSVKALNLELKALRLAGHDVNLERNLFGEGYEQRLERMINDTFGMPVLVVGPQPPKPVAATPSPTAAPVMKTYAPPRRR